MTTGSIFRVRFGDADDAMAWFNTLSKASLNPVFKTYGRNDYAVQWKADLNARAERSVVELIHDTRNQLGAEAVFAGFADDTAVGFKVLASVSQEPFANKVKRSRLMTALAHIYGMVVQVGRDLTAIEEGGAAPAPQELPLRERN